MELTRREFLERAGAVSVFSFSWWRLPWPADGQTDPAERVAEIPLIWMATGACTGCSVSLLNAASPTVRFALVGNVLPGKRLALAFHTTLMASSGDMAMRMLDRVVQEHSGGYVLVVDGATAIEERGEFCAIGERDGKPISGYEHIRDLGRNALATIAIGACASFGGIPAAPPNPTQCISVAELFERERIQNPIINVPGCPPHPDWVIGTISALVLGGLGALKLDALHRPAMFFGSLIHDNCPYRGHFERGEFAQRFGDHGCLIKLGCKGPMTHADCPIRHWNGGVNWCVEAGHPCVGCCEPEFPFEESLFQPVQPAQLTFPGTYPAAAGDRRRQADANTYAAVGMIGTAAFLAGVGVATAAGKIGPADAEVEAEPGTDREKGDAPAQP
ncbi:MAG: Periplasmic [NiFeSe] hydrogenase small subunit [Phycisphaerae bacterium]|nr:Periplasmic [NiFeSe] hydrogenase small subunit [Phycisphaerae bacterium]